MIRLPIALQLYSVRQELAADLEGTLTAVADMGYDGVELSGLGAYRADEMQTALLRRGLTPVSVHVPLAELTADMPSVLGVYAAMGCRCVVVPHLSPDYLPGGAHFLPTLDALCAVGTAAARLGMRLLYHNHDFEFSVSSGKTLLDQLLSQTDPAVLGLQLDVCWAQVGGADPAAVLRQYTARVPLIHLKDYAGGPTDPANGSFEMRPLGRGAVNLPAVLAAAEPAGVDWLVVEQDIPTPGKTALQCARESMDYLKSL